jgi:hypothetical protein
MLLSANSIVCNDRTWQDSMGNVTLLDRKRTCRIHSCVYIADDFLSVVKIVTVLRRLFSLFFLL